MFENVIKFIAQEKYLKHNQDTLPIPAKLNIPEWFKKLEHTHENATIKGCMPFLDTLSSGYLLKMPVDYVIEHNIEVDGEKKTGFTTNMDFMDDGIANNININYKEIPQLHNITQLKDSPLVEKNKNLGFHKILNPFIIKTPPGYSTLFLPPLNNTDDRFSIIPGIVDTDTFSHEVNFPFVVNGDKYPILKTVIKRGTPYVQVIPFKRQSWKMKIESQSIDERKEIILFKKKHSIHNYKQMFWSKKTWK